MQLPFKSDFLAAQWLRTVGHTAAGGADIGECFAAAERVKESDPESWRSAWLDVADRVEKEATRSAAAGCDVSAHAAWLRAANYYRASALFLLNRQDAPKLRETMSRHREVFAAAITAQPEWAESLEIPYEGQFLHGLFFRAPGGAPSPTVIMTGGYDSTAEEAYFFSGTAALARGYNFVSYDGPGQGRALDEGMVFRPDWEAVMASVHAVVETRLDVRADRIVSMGLSFGGYLAPRAATGCQTLAALLADPGQLSLLDEVRSRLPGPFAKALPDGNKALLGALERILAWRRRDPVKGWALRRGEFVHGVDTPIEYLGALAQYTSEGRLDRINCPVFVASAEADAIGATARRLFDGIKQPKTFQRFRVKEGAGEHCEGGARSLFNQRAFDWLASALKECSAEAPRSAEAVS